MYPAKDEKSMSDAKVPDSKPGTYNVPKVGWLHVPLIVNGQDGYNYLLSINNKVYVFYGADLGETADFGGISGKRTDWPLDSMEPWPGHHAYLLNARFQDVIGPKQRAQSSEEPDEIVEQFQPLIEAWSNNRPDLFRKKLREIQESGMRLGPASAEAMLLRFMAGAAIDSWYWKPAEHAEAMKQWNIPDLLDMVGYDHQLQRFLVESRNLMLCKKIELELY